MPDVNVKCASARKRCCRNWQRPRRWTPPWQAARERDELRQALEAAVTASGQAAEAIARISALMEESVASSNRLAGAFQAKSSEFLTRWADPDSTTHWPIAAPGGRRSEHVVRRRVLPRLTGAGSRLSNVVQSYAGGIRLDAIFVDEGFGTLEALDFAIRNLKDLQQAGRMVGIISHVAELKEWIGARLELRDSQAGSEAAFVV